MRLNCIFILSASLFIIPAMGNDIDAYCSMSDLKPGLKPDNPGSLVWGTQLMYSLPVLCYGIYYESKTRVTCVGPRKWSHEYPPCRPKLCENPPVLEVGGQRMTGKEIHSKVTYNCVEGYWYNGTNPRVCLMNQTWSGKMGQCLPVRCPAPISPKNGFIRPPPPYKYKSSVLVSCNPGFIYDKSHKLMCMAKNMWNDTVGQCIEKKRIRCQAVQSSENAVVTPWRKDYNYKNTVHISCPKGFTYNGTRRRTCQVDGSWSGHGGTCNGGESHILL